MFEDYVETAPTFRGHNTEMETSATVVVPSLPHYYGCTTVPQTAAYHNRQFIQQTYVQVRTSFPSVAGSVIFVVSPSQSWRLTF